MANINGSAFRGTTRSSQLVGKLIIDFALMGFICTDGDDDEVTCCAMRGFGDIRTSGAERTDGRRDPS